VRSSDLPTVTPRDSIRSIGAEPAVSSLWDRPVPIAGPEPRVGTLAYGDWLSPTLAPLLLGVIALAVLGTTILFVIGLIGYLRRQTVPYLVITIVLGVLVVRSIVGLGTALGLVPMAVHHLVEHGIDVIIAASLLSLLYRRRSAVQ